MLGKVLYSGFRWPHHDAQSGYHHVVADAKDFVDSGALWGGEARIGSRQRKLNIFLAELVTLARAWRYRAVFYVYPETCALFFSAPLLKLMGKRVIYTLHLGEKYWDRQGSLLFRLKRYNLRFVDHFVVLSSQQKQRLEAKFPRRVSFVPHGVHLGPMPVVPVPALPPRVVVAGDNFRDYAMLREIIECFATRFPQIRFDLVGMQYARLGEAAHAPSVTCHPRLDAVEYSRVIREASFMLLPLHFATANNALLEALAQGVPVLCNRIDGVTDYLPDGDYLFDDIEHLCELVAARLAMTPGQRALETAALREYVDAHFSWPVVRRHIVECCLQTAGIDVAASAAEAHGASPLSR
ncbi:MAG: glycosyltransferase family 4 protein [Pseudomonadota bacterium]